MVYITGHEQWRIQDYREGGALDRAKRATVMGGLGGLPPRKCFES